MVKVLPFRFQQLLGVFIMLLVEGSSVNWLFRELSNHNFSESVISEIHQLWESSFFWKYLKFNADFINREKNWEKAFCFSGNGMWMCCLKMSLLTREYLSSAVTVLTNSLNILPYHFKCNYPTTFFGVSNFGNTSAMFGNTSAMRIIFFWNCSNFNVDFKNQEKNWEKVSCFLGHCIWIGCLKLSLLTWE